MTNYYVMKNNTIVAFDNNKQRLINSYYGEAVKILETKRPIENFEFADTEEYITEQLIKAKEDKHAQNLEKAKYAEQNSLIEYKNCVFETSDSNRGNLRDTSEGIEKGLVENVIWLDKNDVQVSVTLEDIITVRSMILQFVNNLWNVTYLNFKNQIDECDTIEKLNSISIEYDNMPGEYL